MHFVYFGGHGFENGTTKLHEITLKRIGLYTADLGERSFDQLPRIAVVRRAKELAVLCAEEDVVAGRGDGVAEDHFIRILLRKAAA